MGGFLTGVDPGIRKTKTPTVNTFVAGVGFTAGSSTTIALTDAPGTEEHLTIFFDGVGQHRSTYSLSGSTVTFDTAIPTGVAEVEATYAPAVYAQLSSVGDDAVTTAKILNDAVTLDKMASGTDGNIISFDSSGNPVAIATGNDGQVLTSAGAGAQPAFETLTAGWTLGTEQATTSGTAFTFGSIPAGVKHIVVNFVGVSQGSANSRLIVRIGDSGGIETSGYLSTGVQLHLATSSGHGRITDAFNVSALSDFDAAKTVDGAAEFFLEDSSGFTWVMQSYLGCSDQDQSYLSAGSKSLSAELTQLVVTTAGGSTFDAGAVNIMYM